LNEIGFLQSRLSELDVDRYFVLPGIISADETGYYAWRAARVTALQGDAPKYDLASFHDQGLSLGGLPQSLLKMALFSPGGSGTNRE
jgi:uncharacterized protein (DUF885 family)